MDTGMAFIDRLVARLTELGLGASVAWLSALTALQLLELSEWVQRSISLGA